MTGEFMREERYIVFKLSDVEKYLTDKDRANIAMMKMEIAAGRDCANKPPFKGLIVEADWPEYEPTWRAIEARVTGAQPAANFADAYQGAMEEVAIWKKRALEAEDLNRKFIAEINGPMLMGEPVARPAPSIPDDVMRDAKRYRFLRAAKNISISTEAARDPIVYDAAIDAAMLAAAPEAKP